GGEGDRPPVHRRGHLPGGQAAQGSSAHRAAHGQGPLRLAGRGAAQLAGRGRAARQAGGHRLQRHARPAGGGPAGADRATGRGAGGHPRTARRPTGQREPRRPTGRGGDAHPACGERSTMMTVTAETEDLLRTARSVYTGDRAALALIDELEVRLHEPLRVAVAGIVKAGKSTLLNALLGERIAATDTAECTRIVTWYRHSPTPSITMRLRDGSTVRMPIRRDGGLLVFDLGGRTADD